MADVLTGKNGDTEKPSFLKKKKLPTKYLIPMWRRKAAQQAKAPRQPRPRRRYECQQFGSIRFQRYCTGSIAECQHGRRRNAPFADRRDGARRCRYSGRGEADHKREYRKRRASVYPGIQRRRGGRDVYQRIINTFIWRGRKDNVEQPGQTSGLLHCILL